MAIDFEVMHELVGWTFPGGTTSIEHWQNFLLTDVMCHAPLPDDLVHPAACFNTPLAGMGMSFADFFAVCHAESDDAIRAGEYTFDIHRPLREDIEYRVEGHIVDVVRKRGGRIGLFDLVTFVLTMTQPDGEVALTATNSWVFLRTEDV
jgi:hypothetical protein